MEDRRVAREKYSELKLQATFIQSSPAYLTAQPYNGTYGIFADSANLAVTPVVDNATGTGFYVVRQGDFASTSSTAYHLTLPTRAGNLTIPQLDGNLTLNGRDSKIHVTNYEMGPLSMLYSIAEVFTWARQGNKTVLVLYGAEDELHEFAMPADMIHGVPTIIEGNKDGVAMERLPSSIVVNWRVSTSRRIIRFSDCLDVHLLWRNYAYRYWVLDSIDSTAGAPFKKGSPIVINGGYMMRKASVSGKVVEVIGDLTPQRPSKSWQEYHQGCLLFLSMVRNCIPMCLRTVVYRLVSSILHQTSSCQTSVPWSGNI